MGQLGQRLDDGDLGAERRVDVGELEADDAGADDGDVLGDVLQEQALVTRVDRFAFLTRSFPGTIRTFENSNALEHGHVALQDTLERRSPRQLSRTTLKH